jgi:hypothetical protein
MVTALAQLRNRFAHGRLDGMTPEVAEALRKPFRPLVDPARHQRISQDSKDKTSTLFLQSRCSSPAPRSLSRQMRPDCNAKKRGKLTFQSDLKEFLADREE